MSLFESVGGFISNLGKPSSFRKGDSFEKYVEDYHFPKHLYDIVHKTHNYTQNKDRYVESSLQPDFRFRDKLTGREFYLECKYRGGFNGGSLDWCNDEQLIRYKKYDKECPVFLIIGLGGVADVCDHVLFFKLSHLPYKSIFQSVFSKYEVPVDSFIPSRLLWSDFNFKK